MPLKPTLLCAQTPPNMREGGSGDENDCACIQLYTWLVTDTVNLTKESCRAGKNLQSDCLGQVKFCSWVYKNGCLVARSASEISLSSQVLVMISNQKQFQNLTLQDKQNNTLKVWINFKSKNTFLFFVVCPLSR